MLTFIRPRFAPIATERRARQIRLTTKVLLVALTVGLGSPLSSSVAQAPLATQDQILRSLPPKKITQLRVMEQWGSHKEFQCVVDLVHHESRWNPEAHNKSSGAYGLFQFLPSTWGNYKFPYKPKDVTIQITAGLRYITKRYGTPCKAWSFWQIKAKQGNPWY